MPGSVRTHLLSEQVIGDTASALHRVLRFIEDYCRGPGVASGLSNWPNAMPPGK